jgi:REP element-mobilizing transposase RayT
MPRTARLDIPGLLQHVIVRGIEKRDLFLDDDDRSLFVERFSTLLKQTDTHCYAWALMSNHFHLLLMPTSCTLSSFMRRLLTSYAVNFNRIHTRSGHLFQNRYKSIVCEEETYLLELVRYIHLNPLRAGLVKELSELDQYPWSGHAVLMGNRQTEGQEITEILLRFGKRINKARPAYRAFIADGIKAGQRAEFVGGGLKRSMALKGADEKEWGNFDARILGSSNFVDSLQQHETLRDRLPLAMPLAELIRRVAASFDLPAEAVSRHGKARPTAEARGVVAYFAVRELGLRGIDVGKAINLTSAGVSIAVQRGEQLVREKPELKKILPKLVE